MGQSIPDSFKFADVFFSMAEDEIKKIDAGFGEYRQASKRQQTIVRNSLLKYREHLFLLSTILQQIERIERKRYTKNGFEPIKEASPISFDTTQDSGREDPAKKKRGRPKASPSGPFEWRGSEEERDTLFNCLREKGWLPKDRKGKTKQEFCSIFPTDSNRNSSDTNSKHSIILWRGSVPQLGELFRQLRDKGLIGQSGGFYKKIAFHFQISESEEISEKYLQSSSAMNKGSQDKDVSGIINRIRR